MLVVVWISIEWLSESKLWRLVEDSGKKLICSWIDLLNAWPNVEVVSGSATLVSIPEASSP